MRIAIPTNGKNALNDEVAEHFGRCQTYTFLNEKGELLEVIDNISEHMGGVGLPPELMKKNDANVLLCKDLGPRALNLCDQLGIDVYVNDAKTVREIFELWRRGELKKASAEDSCTR